MNLENLKFVNFCCTRISSINPVQNVLFCMWSKVSHTRYCVLFCIKYLTPDICVGTKAAMTKLWQQTITLSFFRFPTDTSLRDGLFHEYKRFGKVMSVTLKGEKEQRIAVVTFKKADDAQKAYEQSIGHVFFGKKIQVQQHNGFNEHDEDFKPPEAELDEYHHKSTRTLFVGNLDTGIEAEILQDVFRHYGHILVSYIDIRKCYEY